MDITINMLLFFFLFTFDKANLQTEIFFVCFIFLPFSLFSEYLSASIGEILEIILIGFLTLTNTVKIVKMAAPIKIITFGETSTDRFEYSFVINPIANGRIAFPRKYPINNPHGSAISNSHNVCIRTKNFICF